jgi:tetratricopeptide (TPR) repeat protein
MARLTHTCLFLALLCSFCAPAQALTTALPSLDRDLNRPTGTLLYAISAQLASRGELLAAESLLQPAIGLMPQDAMVWVTYAYVLEGLGKPQLAADYYQQALDLDSNLFQARYSLAMLLDKMGKTRQGIFHLHKAIGQTPKNAMMYYDLGVLYARVNDFDQAAEYSRLATVYDTSLSEGYNNQAYALAHLNRLDEALAAINQALELKPDSAAALDSKGYILLKMNKYAEALQVFLQAADKDPTIGEIYLHMGQVHEKLGDAPAMIAAYQRYLELTPEASNRASVQAKILRQSQQVGENKTAVAAPDMSAVGDQ